jgi:hypothetical protein
MSAHEHRLVQPREAGRDRTAVSSAADDKYSDGLRSNPGSNWWVIAYLCSMNSRRH